MQSGQRTVRSPRDTRDQAHTIHLPWTLDAALYIMSDENTSDIVGVEGACNMSQPRNHPRLRTGQPFRFRTAAIKGVRSSLVSADATIMLLLPVSRTCVEQWSSNSARVSRNGENKHSRSGHWSFGHLNTFLFIRLNASHASVSSSSW